MNESIIVAKIV